MTGASVLSATRLEVGWGGRPLLPALDIAVREGELWGLVGRNGAGKSTLLRTLLGVQTAVAGSITRPANAIGYVPQRSEWESAVPARVIDLTLAGLDAGWSSLLPLRPRGSRKKALAALAVAHADDLAGRRYTALSEGQKQRVWLARALVGEPRLLVLDEPTSALDPAAERAVFDLITELIAARRLAVLIASHELGLLFERASHLVYVDRDEGLALAGEKRAVLAHPAVRRRHLIELAEVEPGGAVSPSAAAAAGAPPDA